MKQPHLIRGNIVDIFSRETFFGEVTIEDKLIKKIIRIGEKKDDASFILPGFIDSHVHIESSMLIPTEFARIAAIHGTTGTVSDPHEIANVCGMAGVRFMIENARNTPFKFHFGAPSCVPATIFETAGAALDANEVSELLHNPDIYYLSEMMNFPGVLNGDAEVMKKINAAKLAGKPVDGHAPGLRGGDTKKYIDAGISTDHECFTAEEAVEKLSHGMKILIREGSAAKNFDALIGLLNEHDEDMMFCSDDKHPDSLADGHINALCARAVAAGINVFNVLRAACINPVLHYKMRNGLLREGDAADLVVVKNLVNFNVVETYIDGELAAANGKSLLPSHETVAINRFTCSEKKPADFSIEATAGLSAIPVIEALDGQLITNKLVTEPLIKNNFIVPDPARDILKIVVVNRYKTAPVAVAFVKNFGIKDGAIASSVAHDSHNIIAVGTDDEQICKAVNLVIREHGGVSAVSSSKEMILALPVAGLMTTADGFETARAYTAIDHFVKEDLKSTLGAPFMTLSFMALLVIPHLKLSDKGLFDGDAFQIQG